MARPRLEVDRDLPVPVPTQLQGQIEYGMSTGDFPPGSQLPSVRELSNELGVSPVTVSQVYRALRDKGLIASVPGRGTFVTSAAPPPDDTAGGRVDEALARLVRVAAREGVPRNELVARLQRTFARLRDDAPSVTAFFVGVYAEVTRAYVADLERHLQPNDALEATTFGALAATDRRLLARLRGADLVLTFPHRAGELAGLLGPDVAIAPVHLIPSERTRVALAELDPLADVVLVSTVPGFVSTFRRSVARFASHVERTRVVVWGSPEAAAAAREADVVIYGTGSERVLDGLPGHVRSFEFRHVPDPIHVERVVLPLVARVREEREAATSGRVRRPSRPRAHHARRLEEAP